MEVMLMVILEYSWAGYECDRLKASMAIESSRDIRAFSIGIAASTMSF